jgi:hypothetical protein
LFACAAADPALFAITELACDVVVNRVGPRYSRGSQQGGAAENTREEG